MGGICGRAGRQPGINAKRPPGFHCSCRPCPPGIPGRAADPSDVAASWAGAAKEGVAPHGEYKNVFDHPDSWPPAGVPIPDPWVSHWRPIGSLRKDEVS